MASITITIQAASDSIMTENGSSGGTPLEEGDARKVYGLPNITSAGLTGSFGDPPVKTTAKISWIKSPRWDEIEAFEYQGPKYDSGWNDYEWAYTQSLYSGDTGGGTRL